MRVLFRTDSSARIGGGHAARCLALADELLGRGAETLFVCGDVLDWVARRITMSGHKLHHLPSLGRIDVVEAGWEEQRWSEEVQEGDAQLTGVAAGPCDWVAVDHYALDATWGRTARSFTTRILVVDDLANRAHDCDVLLDQNMGRAAADYGHLIPPGARLLVGPYFALLRPEFAAARSAALARRRALQAPARLLLSLGSTDIGGITATVLEAVLSEGVAGAIDVIYASESAESLRQARLLAEAHANVTIHVGANMVGLLSSADLAIGAAGGSAWERCCLGLPSVVLVIAENQRLGAESLASVDAAMAVATPEAAARTAAALLRDPERLAAMTAAATAVTDGRGAERVADTIDTGSSGG